MCLIHLGSGAAFLTALRLGDAVPCAHKKKLSLVLIPGKFCVPMQVNVGMIGGGTVGSGVFHAWQRNGGLMASFEDTNGDGLADLVLHFRRTDFVSASNLSSGTARAVLLATLKDGCVQVRGSTSIRAVP